MKNLLTKYKHKNNVCLSNKDMSDDTINYIISTCRNHPKSFVLLPLSSDEEIKKLSKRVLYKIGNELDSISFSEILFSNGSVILFETMKNSVDNTIICVK